MGNQTIRSLADIGFTFLDEPASAEQGITKTKADATDDRKRAEPAEFAASVLAVGNRQPRYQDADSHALNERGDERASGKPGVPDPPHALRLVTVFERHPAQNQPRQHDQERQIKRREKRRADDRKRTAPDCSPAHAARPP